MKQWFFDWLTLQAQTTKYLYIVNGPQAVIREHINALWFVMAMSGLVCFSYIFFDAIRQVGWRAARRTLYVRAAASLMILFLSQSLYRGWIWLLLVFESRGYTTAVFNNSYWIAIVACALSVWANLCILIVFGFQKKTWITISIMWFVFLVLELYITS